MTTVPLPVAMAGKEAARVMCVTSCFHSLGFLLMSFLYCGFVVAQAF